MGTRSSPLDLWDIVRGIQRRLHALETARGITPPVTWDTAWQTPALLNGWVNYGAGFHGAAYRKLQSGLVEVRGLIKSGANLTTIMQLPTGYRPAASLIMATFTNEVFGRVDVQSDGIIAAISTNPASLSINFTFFADQ